MLKFSTIPDGSRVLFVGTGNSVMSFLIIFTPDVGGYMGCKPVVSQLDRFGDRSCEHCNFHGDILFDPWAYRQASTLPLYSGHKFFYFPRLGSSSIVQGYNFVVNSPFPSHGLDVISDVTHDYVNPPTETNRLHTYYMCYVRKVRGTRGDYVWAIATANGPVASDHHVTNLSYLVGGMRMTSWGKFNGSSPIEDGIDIPMASIQVAIPAPTKTTQYWYNKPWEGEHGVRSCLKGWADSIAEYGTLPNGTTYTNTVYSSASIVRNHGSHEENRLDKTTTTSFSLKRIAEHLNHDVPPTDPNLWGDLSLRSIEDARYLSCNTGMYAYELTQMRKSLDGVVDAVKRKNLSSVSDLYLAYHYGAKLTVQDTRSISKAVAFASTFVNRKIHACCRAMSASSSIGSSWIASHWNITYNQKVYYDPRDEAVLKSFNTMMNWDLFPSLSNVWDVIPYSFVLDWGIGVQDALKRLDYNTYVATLNLYGSIQTIRARTDIEEEIWIRLWGLEAPSVDTSNLFSTVSYVHYTRETISSVAKPTFRIDTADSFHNYVEGAALLVQKF